MMAQNKHGRLQESVWDYPRPPRLEDSPNRVRVIAGGLTVADSTRSKRILETSHPPTFYIHPDDVESRLLRASTRRSWCEWKGEAHYYSIVLPQKTWRDAAWSYADPREPYAELAGYVAFYPSRVDACYVDDEKVLAQPGDFYGGWITSNLVGPFKGAPGTSGW